MKNTKKVLGVIVILAVIGFGMTNCSSEEAEAIIGKALARYLTADEQGNVYELIINQADKKSAAGSKGDFYSLGVWTNGKEADTSEGTVSSVTDTAGGAKYKLKGGKTEFDVETSDSVPANSTTPPADYKWTVLSVEKASLLAPYPHN